MVRTTASCRSRPRTSSTRRSRRRRGRSGSSRPTRAGPSTARWTTGRSGSATSPTGSRLQYEGVADDDRDLFHLIAEAVVLPLRAADRHVRLPAARELVLHGEEVGVLGDAGVNGSLGQPVRRAVVGG